jgi:hypothetical protein
VVLLDQRVKHLGEVLVGVAIASVDAAVLVVELDGAGDGLGQGEAGGGGLVLRELEREVWVSRLARNEEELECGEELEEQEHEEQEQEI